ncbi:leucyl aminopeptidase [Sphingomonas gellani]|uniref:Probable cytosol aminopeptidase n=1 Tax=Sphingomonas gellani TaxID=1166340 RepID=A0A1H7ZRT9_9SPHN|nr:leucyl aminopeptidase [Sphingomonas gellani]SEM61145.1 leucyl aminopeptidase [Sphingomonas gellani]
MQIDFVAGTTDAAILAIPVLKDGMGQIGWNELDAGASGVAEAAAKAARFSGDAGSTVDVFVGGEATRRLILLGVGSGDEEGWAKAGGALTAKLLSSGAEEVAVDCSRVAAAPSAKAVARFAAAAAQRAWRFDQYRTKMADDARPTLHRIAIAGATAGTEEAWAAQSAVTDGMALTRQLVSEPPNILYPETFVEQVLASVDGLGLDVTVLDEAAMRELGMGSLLGVSQGSAREGRLLALKWNGAGEGDPAVALVGKGVTFDTGGISIKPSAGMEDMKWDMGGAGAVAGAMKALALRKAKANVIGVMGLVENMPDGNATRPGDVLTSMSGQTIEVLNTDAEGRLVLADAITWVQRTHHVGTIVDLATLTGAMIVSLGNEYGGLFSNTDELARQLEASGLATGDKLWRFPLSPVYDKMIDSQIADMKNIGGKGAGSITAAQFIQRFIEDGVRWAHLDIAGMVWSDKPGTHHDKGATGYGVRLLDRFVAEAFEA